MLELLKEAIKGYSILEDTTYIIRLKAVKKGELEPGAEIDLEIKFQAENFFHLFGFQYLENLTEENGINKKVMFKSFRKSVYKDIPLEENRYYKSIVSSPTFSTSVIQSRLEVIKDLPYLLDRTSKKNTYWHYEGFKGIVTDIEWNYLVVLNSDETSQDKERYLFVRESDEANYFIPVSIFAQDFKPGHKYKDYKKGQPRYDVLKVTKKCF